LGEYTIQPTFF
jgi:hypothetical protein